MAVTFTARLLHLNDRFVAIGRASYRKIVYLGATFPSSLFTRLLDGRDQPPMRGSMKMHDRMISKSQLASTTLRTAVIHFAPNSWFPIEMCATILLSGGVQTLGRPYIFMRCYTTKVGLGCAIHRSYLIFGTLLRGMSSSAFLVY